MKYTVAIAALAGVALASPSLAEDTGFYVGGSVGYAYLQGDGGTKIEDQDFEFDDDDVGYKVFAGWQVLSFLAVEGGYVDFGEVKDTTPLTRTRIATDGWSAFAVGNLPLGFIDLFGKVGVIRYDADLDFDGSNSSFKDSESGTDAAYGLGAAIELGSFAIRGEWEYFDVDGLDDLSMFSVGATYQF
ncbi:outer membrane beta-barrel protein [Parahaliea mediterranea]|uniref:Porin family protein n=1 Tax=Parahaliea mediterranea TaxID=651086 RepID=A0A939DFZ4_9GAMM|nr:outer membrane beta-barrel protein [Parahaliea mediterranea]MBN7796837.1 porin family protein [Parahaliea mediterranea]